MRDSVSREEKVKRKQYHSAGIKRTEKDFISCRFDCELGGREDLV